MNNAEDFFSARAVGVSFIISHHARNRRGALQASAELHAHGMLETSADGILNGEVTCAAGPTVGIAHGVKLRSGRTLDAGFKRNRSSSTLGRLAEVPASTGDSSDEEQTSATLLPPDTWAPRVARRGVPSPSVAPRRSGGGGGPSLVPLPLIKSGASDLLGSLDIVDRTDSTSHDEASSRAHPAFASSQPLEHGEGGPQSPPLVVRRSEWRSDAPSFSRPPRARRDP